MSQSHQLLIIGGSNAGKTHFVGQLYNRLDARRSTFRMVTAPVDLTAIKAVIDRLARGLAGEHTESGLNEEINFIVANDQTEITLTFPDYAGEQIRHLIQDRLVTKRWQELIAQSDEWLLLIRPDEILPLEDITTRGFAHLEDLRQRAAKVSDEVELSTPSFYIELLQMMLYIKGKSVVSPISKPRLTVALSCWDTLDFPDSGIIPLYVLQERLPFLAGFLETAWLTESWRVCGLSSLGRTLDAEQADEDFVDDGPETAGYVVLPSGIHDTDLTQLITF